MTLEGKINVEAGDIVLLSNKDKKTKVAGYVRSIEKKTICLSQDEPLAYSWGSVTISNREYKLSDFTEYEILKKKGE